MIFRSRETEFRVQDNELGAHARMQEAMLVLRGVVGPAGQGEVFTARQACGNSYDGNSWLFDLFWYISTFG